MAKVSSVLSFFIKGYCDVLTPAGNLRERWRKKNWNFNMPFKHGLTYFWAKNPKSKLKFIKKKRSCIFLSWISCISALSIHTAWVQKSDGFFAPKNRIKYKRYKKSHVYRKGRNPASYVLRLLELYERMHLVNYNKKIIFLSQSVSYVRKESSCLAADVQYHHSLESQVWEPQWTILIESGMRTLMNCFWRVRYENLCELFFRDSGMRTLVNYF